MVDIRPFLISWKIKQAREGYKLSALEALNLISSLLKEGKELPIEARQFLSMALDDISSGGSPTKALLLNGRKNRDKLQEERDIAEMLFVNIDQKGEKGEWVFTDFSTNDHKKRGPDYFKAAYYSHRDFWKSYYEEKFGYFSDDEQ